MGAPGMGAPPRVGAPPMSGGQNPTGPPPTQLPGVSTTFTPPPVTGNHTQQKVYGPPGGAQAAAAPAKAAVPMFDPRAMAEKQAQAAAENQSRGIADAFGGGAPTQPPPGAQAAMFPTTPAAAPQRAEQSFSALADKFESLTITGFNPASINPDQLPRPLVPGPATNLAQVEPASRLEPLNAHPRFVRLCTNLLPNQGSVRNMWKLPLGAIIQPMAEVSAHEEPIPVVNFGRVGVVRCRHCRTYINPFVSFTEGGRRWKCNVCGVQNDVSSEYFSSLDEQGQRNDIEERPELTRGNVEFVAPQEYMVRPPQPPVYVFVIDVSMNAVATRMVHKAVEAILASLDRLPGGARTRIGFITFDNTVHFYNIKSTLKQPQVMVVSDVEDIFLPLPDDMLVTLAESREVVTQLLNDLTEMYKDTQVVESCMGSALEAAYQLMQHIGGKMVVFQSTLPTVGLGKLKNRESAQAIGSEAECKLISCQDESYRKLGALCSRHQICVDMFVTAAQYADVATLGFLPKITGGSLHSYPGFQDTKDGIKFCHELLRCLSRETAFEAVMRIRMSKGYKVTQYYGNFLNRSSDLLALPNCDSDKAFGIQIGMEDGVQPGAEAYMQTALLYTTSGGERRIRVHTIRIPTTGQIADVFASVDEDAMVCLMAKIAADRVVQQSSRGLKDARDLFEQRTVETYRMYRTLFPAQEKTPDRLLYPKALSNLAVESMALMKSAAFRPGTSTSLDQKTNLMIQIGSMSVKQSASFSYPRLYALHTLGQGAGDRDQASGMVVMPAPLRLSADQLSSEGLFLIEDGLQITMFVGKLCPPLLIQAVFGINTLDGIEGASLMLPLLPESAMSQKVNNIVNSIRGTGSTYANVCITKEGEKSNNDFLSLLIEDRAQAASLSYADYLCHIHRNSQAPGAH